MTRKSSKIESGRIRNGDVSFNRDAVCRLSSTISAFDSAIRLSLPPGVTQPLNKPQRQFFHFHIYAKATCIAVQLCWCQRKFPLEGLHAAGQGKNVPRQGVRSYTVPLAGQKCQRFSFPGVDEPTLNVFMFAQICSTAPKLEPVRNLIRAMFISGKSTARLGLPVP